MNYPDRHTVEWLHSAYRHDQREQRRREVALRRLIAELASVCASNDWRNAAPDLRERAREASDVLH